MSNKIVDQNNYPNLHSTTPKPKKAQSMLLTANNYLHLQLITSTKKRQQTLKTLESKDRRIKQLEDQILQNQALVRQTVLKCKQLIAQNQTYQQQTIKLKQIIQQFNKQQYQTNQKIKMIEDENFKLRTQNMLCKQNLQIEKNKAENEKAKRIKFKNQYKNILFEMIEQINHLKEQLYGVNQKSQKSQSKQQVI